MKTKKEIKTITPRAEKIVRNHVLLSMGVAAIPIPMLDFIMVYYIQMDMLKQLSQEYNKNYYAIKGKAYISALASNTLARLGSSLIKTIPGVGSVLGGVSSVVVSGAGTYALGKVAARFYQDNIELSDIDMDLAKTFFKEEFKAGKALVKGILKEKKEQKRKDPKGYERKAAAEKEIYQRMITLQKLQKEGLITLEEYEAKRLKLVEELDLL